MGISPAYYLDEMEFYELSAMVDGYSRREQAGWEQARFCAFYTASAAGAKLSMKEIVVFPWEKEKEDAPEEVNIDDLRQLKEKVKMINNGR